MCHLVHLYYYFFSHSLHQNNFLELIWWVEPSYSFFLIQQKKYAMGSLLRLLLAVMNLCTATYRSYFCRMQSFLHAKDVQ